MLEPWYDRSHDVFFDWLVAAGALGLITYLSLYGVTVWFMWKKENNLTLIEKAILTGMLAGYFIHNIFVFDNLTSYILFFAVLAYITVRTRAEVTHGHPVFDKEQMNLLVVPIIGILLLVTLYSINYRPLVVNGLVIRAMSFGEYSKTMPFADAVKIVQDSFTQAIAMDTLGSTEAREQFLQMSVRMGQIKIPETLSQDQKQAIAQAINNLLQAARKDVITSLPANKEDVRMLSIYGMFFNGIGDPASGEEILKVAHGLAPNKQMLSFDLVRSYLMEKKFADAYAVARSTYDLAINCPDALKWYTVTAAYAGQFEDARAYATSKGQTVVADPDILSGVVAAGQTNLAVKLLNEMKLANPSLASQIDAYIQQLLAGKK
jgi:hypothetical protein